VEVVKQYEHALDITTVVLEVLSYLYSYSHCCISVYSVLLRSYSTVVPSKPAYHTVSYIQ